MSSLPLPVRIAAGLAATAVDQARKLPDQLTGLPVTVFSRALQTSMRVQQQITELAIRGDEVFALLRSADETAPWARFDEDEVGTEHHNGVWSTAVAPDRFAPEAPTPAPAPQPVARDRAGQVRELHEPHEADELQEPHEADEADEKDVARELSPRGTPPALPGYDEMSLPQLRGKLRALSLQQLEELLSYERSHRDRAPFVTMLSNRITTVRSR